ncbi:ATP-binding protein [Bradyrhizobium japonicum]|uniref:ATP-binding protein n=1 Tax=Bradyrhizobium japonicum TaxID=375 RepID=UPI001FCDA8DC|nr:winged helix-turn-helix domain-containing protein [Bradyrhizobium japonicum]
MAPDRYSSAAQIGAAVSFGPFCLTFRERRLTRDGAPLEIGARTFDLLVALVSRPGEVLMKGDLLAAVWRDVTVDEGNLRFHIARLRKVLGDAGDEVRYISTMPGRGYCFVAPVTQLRDLNPARSGASHSYGNLPNRSDRMVGRADDVAALSRELMASRFISVLGPGGVGKTTVAVATAHSLLESFAGAVVFYDVSLASDSTLIAPALASMLGLSVQSDDTVPALVAYLQDKRMLMVFDTCEHLVDMVAELTEQIFSAAPEIHILVTSREAIRVKGEHIYRLAPLGLPPPDQQLTAPALLRFPATQLFVERMMAGGSRSELGDTDAAIVASICRKLDGLPLAIQLAAGRVEAYGLAQTVALLDQHLALPWLGQRSAPPRQRTLQATLDWSYWLLSESERTVLRRLTIFAGHFTLEAALAVVSSAPIDQGVVLAAVDGLVAKSMLAAHPAGASLIYRLLDTTRAYALEIRVDATEASDLSARHASYYKQLLEEVGSEWQRPSNSADRTARLTELNEVRAALHWCFGSTGNVTLGIELAAAAAPLFLTMSFLVDCQRWTERAIEALDHDARGGHEEMRLQAALGVSLMFLHGNTIEARNALISGLGIAEQRGDDPAQLQLLCRLQLFHLRVGDFKSALLFAKRGSAVAVRITDPNAVVLAHSMLGISLHLAGDLCDARAELETALSYWTDRQPTSMVGLNFGHDNRAEIILSWTLWLLGHPAQAVALARQNIEHAESLNHPVMLSYALMAAVHLFLWTGDLDSAENHLKRVILHDQRHALLPHSVLSRGYTGEIAIRRGDIRVGVEILRDCLQAFNRLNYRSLATSFRLALAQGLIATGQFVEAGAAIDNTVRLIAQNGDLSYMPEALRVKGTLLLSVPQPMRDEAESYFKQSLELSRLQANKAWELRAATNLARLLAEGGEVERARATLQAALAQFTEVSDTLDLREAAQLLSEFPS